MDDWTDGSVAAEIVHDALRAENPVLYLREAVAEAIKSGVDREVVVAGLSAEAASLRAKGQDEKEDVVLDVLDFLTGWASPHMKL